MRAGGRRGTLSAMDLVSALCDPRVHGPATGSVELRETHVSWVFLAGDRALKVKKPVVLPFLDQGSLARRRAACHAEVELNRRLAPAVYLGVRAIVPGPAGSVRLAAADTPGAVEYAVEMHRFHEEDTLEARLAAHRVDAGTVGRLGAFVARFHRDAPAAAGGAEEVERALADSFASLGALRAEAAALTALRRFAAAFLDARRADLDARGQAGLVRDVHGDLRAQHVLLRRAGVEIVDCVEFSDRLRQIDVGADLAFLVMDLHRLRRPDLADALVDGYRAAGGDPGDDPLIAFHAMARALVRAKVALFRGTPGAEREAAALIALAGRLAWRARGPMVIALAGVAASGKSTLARALAAASGLPRLDSDVVRKELAAVPPLARAPVGVYDAAHTRATYAELAHRVEAAGGGVLVEATFRRRAQRATLVQAAQRLRRPLVFVECVVPERVLLARAAARPHDVSDAGPEVVEHQLADREPFDEVPAGMHVPLRADRPVGELVAAVQDALDQLLRARSTLNASPASSGTVARASAAASWGPDRGTVSKRSRAAGTAITTKATSAESATASRSSGLRPARQGGPSPRTEKT